MYTDLFMDHAKSVDSQADYRSLLSQTLCDVSSQTFSAYLKTESVCDAYIAGIGEQVRLGVKANTWCSMLELAGLSSVLGCPVHSVYQNFSMC